MRALTARQKAALRNDAPVATFLDLDHPEGMQRFWTGTGRIDVEGIEYIGCGIIGAIGGVGADLEATVSSVVLGMTGLPQDIGLVNVDLKGRQGVLYDGWLDVKGQVIDGLVQADVIDLDFQEVEAAEDGTITVRIKGQSGLWQLELASNLVWSPERQRQKYPEEIDTGLDALPDLEDLELNWTRT